MRGPCGLCELFGDVDHALPTLQPLPQDWFAPSEWVWALRQLRPHKAVPWGSASVVAWQSKAEAVAPILSGIALSSLSHKSQPSLHPSWSEAQLAWVAKQRKAPTAPGNLRTIGLLAPDAKAFLIILIRKSEPLHSSCTSGCTPVCVPLWHVHFRSDPPCNAALHVGAQNLAGVWHRPDCSHHRLRAGAPGGRTHAQPRFGESV